MRLATSSPSLKPIQSIQLVAYSGKQIPGFKVSMVPQGWEVQGGSDYVLLLAPKGFKDQNLDSFEGKIAVMLQSAAAAETDAAGTPDPPGITTTPVKVGDARGLLRVEAASSAFAGSTNLTFNAGKDQGVVVQVPATLGWDSKQVITFALGVKVLGNAKPGLG
jgi:hypothetical protein